MATASFFFSRDWLFDLQRRQRSPEIRGMACPKFSGAQHLSIALSLHSNGEYPSLKRVKKALNGPLGVVVSEAGAVLREVRRELGLTKDG